MSEPEPTWLPWDELEARFHDAVAADFSSWIASDQPHHATQLEFAHSRLAEGRGIVEAFREIRGLERGPLRCLDVGAGNGGLALAVANVRRTRVVMLDRQPNVTLTRALAASGLPVPVRRTLADANELPYERAAFDLVLLVDVLEHVRRPRRMGAEIMRVLRPGGVCFVTTPARLRYFWRPDPHYGIRGLVALPNAVQRLIVDRVLRLRVQGSGAAARPAYDVEHTFWSVGEIARLFPGRGEVRPLYGFPLQPPSLFNREGLRTLLKNFVFHHVLIWKLG